MKGRRGISPVIATVIIVAVTIAVAIAVAFWMTGIIGLFTGFEQLQITSIYDDESGIHLTVKNTGTATASITEVYVNGRPCVQLGACTVKYDLGNQKDVKLEAGKSIPLKPGESATLRVTSIDPEKVGKVGPGVSVEVKLLTASGKEYPKLIVLQAFSARAPTPTPSQPSTGGTNVELSIVECCKHEEDNQVFYIVTVKVDNKGQEEVTVNDVKCLPDTVFCKLTTERATKEANDNDNVKVEISLGSDQTVRNVKVTLLSGDKELGSVEVDLTTCEDSCRSQGTS